MIKIKKVISIIEKILNTVANISGLLLFLVGLLVSLFVCINTSRWHFALDDPNKWEETTGIIKASKVVQKLNLKATDMDDKLFESKSEAKIPLLNKITDLIGYENSKLDYSIKKTEGNKINMTMYTPSVNYSYSINGIDYSSSTISGNNANYDNYEDAYQFLRLNKFINDFKSKVYYLKSDPSKSVLLLETHTSMKGLMIGSLLFFIIFTTVFILYMKKVVIKGFRHQWL